MKATRKRLKDIESSLGPSDEHSVRVEFYDISPDGEEIPWPGKSDNRPAKKVIRVRFDYRGANGPELWKERLAEIGATGEALKRSRYRRKRFAEPSKPTDGSQ
ncbi:MAG TPA: hypothetical protein VIY49_35820 [Bryobacteraceae bacterium]